jgi:hypothetical protein
MIATDLNLISEEQLADDSCAPLEKEMLALEGNPHFSEIWDVTSSIRGRPGHELLVEIWFSLFSIYIN